MQLKDRYAKLYVGGGITKDSNPLAEWEETVNKAKVLKQLL
jgi:isochorismate synthase